MLHMEEMIIGFRHDDGPKMGRSRFPVSGLSGCVRGCQLGLSVRPFSAPARRVVLKFARPQNVFPCWPAHFTQRRRIGRNSIFFLD